MAPFVITIRKVLFHWARPEILAPTAMKDNILTIDKALTQFEVEIIIKENLVVKASDWEAPITKVVDALLKVPQVDSLSLNITWESRVYSVGQVLPSTIPTAVVDMITDQFGLLRGVTNAVVSGLGAGPGDALVAQVKQQHQDATGTERKSESWEGRDGAAVQKRDPETPSGDKVATGKKRKAQDSPERGNSVATGKKRKAEESPENHDVPGRRYNLRRR